MARNSPDFAIVGAAKSGTTIVWQWLHQHPLIFVPNTKEPHYFCFAGKPIPHANGELDPFYKSTITNTADRYDALWDGAAPFQIKGEASPGYLYFPKTAARLAEANPNCKVIVILRDPVKRAFSQFMHHVRDGYEPLRNFEEALEAEQSRIAKGWWWGFHYKTAGLYSRQWQHYCAAFPEQQRLLLLYDDLVANPQGCYNSICEFLGVTPQRPDFSKHVNETAALKRVVAPGTIANLLRHGTATTYMMRNFMPRELRLKVKRKILNLHTLPAPVCTPETNRMLYDFYSSDIDALARLTGKDLSNWQHCDCASAKLAAPAASTVTQANSHSKLVRV